MFCCYRGSTTITVEILLNPNRKIGWTYNFEKKKKRFKFICTSITNDILLHQNRKIGCSTNDFGGDRQEACLVLISEFFTKSLLSSTFYPDTCKMKRATENKSIDSLPEQNHSIWLPDFFHLWGGDWCRLPNMRAREEKQLTHFLSLHPPYSITDTKTMKYKLNSYPEINSFSWILPL